MQNKILICISSSIAGYKIVDLIKQLQQSGDYVDVALTQNALRMFGAEIFEKVTGRKVFTELFWPHSDYKDYVLKDESHKQTIPHIDLADNYDLILVAPATANIIGKLASGIYDDLITSVICATNKPILLAPAMNVKMWLNPVVQENIEKLKKYNFQVIDPESGLLACGYEGIGRLASTQSIFDQIQNLLNKSTSLAGKKILITGGGTTENIDAVRTISNLSSGKMAACIARECLNRGAKVLYLKAKTAVQTSFFVQTQEFVSSQDLENLIEANIANFDLIIHAAAVSDFTVENKTKLSSSEAQTLNLIPASKILPKIKEWNLKIKVISFKAESNLSKKRLNSKVKNLLDSNQTNLIVANDISANEIFGSDQNKVIIFGKKDFEIETEYLPKPQIAKIILDSAVESGLV
ncbi:MAG: bifunctional phosphopantothenoylcysteine decarboxylase/phosphopantothenate--cysteine ligase CoaBC [bacterium]